MVQASRAKLRKASPRSSLAAFAQMCATSAKRLWTHALKGWPRSSACSLGSKAISSLRYPAAAQRKAPPVGPRTFRQNALARSL